MVNCYMLCRVLLVREFWRVLESSVNEVCFGVVSFVVCCSRC